MGKSELTYEAVLQSFADAGCRLLTARNEFQGSKTTLRYECHCRRVAKVLWGNWRKKPHKGCKECSWKSRDYNQKLSTDRVKEKLKEAGFRLIGIYKNSSTPMLLRCGRGHEFNLRWGDFQQGRGCSRCYHDRNAIRRKHDFEYVKDVFRKEGCELLATTEYVNSNTLMAYICKCGRHSTIRLTDFQRGRRCVGCYKGKRGHGRRLTLEYAQEVFRKGGCTLLADVYVNAVTKMPHTLRVRQRGNDCIEPLPKRQTVQSLRRQ